MDRIGYYFAEPLLAANAVAEGDISIYTREAKTDLPSRYYVFLRKTV